MERRAAFLRQLSFLLGLNKARNWYQRSNSIPVLMNTNIFIWIRPWVRFQA